MSECHAWNLSKDVRGGHARGALLWACRPAGNAKR